jgi:alpha-galactosidase
MTKSPSWSTLFALILLLISVPVRSSRAAGETYSSYREQDQTWIIGNHSVQAAFQLTPSGHFRSRWLRDSISGRTWRGSEFNPRSPISLTVDGTALDADTRYSLLQYSFDSIDSPAAGVRVTIVLAPDNPDAEIRFEAEIYTGEPFVRYRTTYKNTGPQPGFITQADMLSWSFYDEGETYRDFFVNQWKWNTDNFEPHETNLSQQNGPIEMFTGASASHTAWRALRDSRNHGLIAAWEFDGRALAHVEHARGERTLTLDANVQELNHPVNSGEEFHVPDAFIGLFNGDWEEAGYRTQRFVEHVLAFPIDDPDFPYVMYDTWGYGTDIDEDTAKTAARAAARAGVEVFILDFGWARKIGDWYPDPEKFPEGLKPLSDYVHSLGMKFGLHIPFLEAAPDSPVILEHPDWEAIDPNRYSYFGATSICPSHKPARDWIISEIIRIIAEYGVDWVTQDGENMVKFCASTSHSHAVGDSNYSNAVDGLDVILHEVQAQTPGVLWENCEDGGSMQTFHMVQHYVTSIVNDDADSLTTRKGIYGATYPFPPRYTERYMKDDPENSYRTRSHMFGGPFVLMNRVNLWFDAVDREVAIYKRLRSLIRDSEIYHLTAPPDGEFNDAMEAYNPQQDEAVIFVYGAESKSTVTYTRPSGLDPNTLYRVSFLEVQHSYLARGQDLMQKGIPVIIQPDTAEVVAITRP